MKQASLKLTALVMLIGGYISGAKAQSGTGVRNPSVVTTAVPFLRISPDARAGGMADVGIATLPDVYSGYWNQGKTIFNTNNAGIGITYTPWLNDLDLNDVFLASLAGYYKLDDLQALTASLRYFSLGDIQFTDALGNQLNNFRPREYAIDLGYSRKLSNKFGLGISLRYISSDLAGGSYNNITYKKGTAVAGDIHLYHQGTKENGEGLNWGLTLSNLGNKISYTNDATQKDYIPANIGLGASYTKAFDADNSLSFAVDLNKLLVPTPPSRGSNDTDSSFQVRVNDYRSKGVVSSWFSSFGDSEDNGGELREVTAAIGMEYWYKKQFAFRAGYFYEHPDKGNRKYFTLGATIKYNVAGLNFSYLLPNGSGVNRNPLSNTLRFSLVFDLAGKK